MQEVYGSQTGCTTWRPKDGLVLGTTSRAAPFASLLGTQGGTNFDPTKFSWIGSANNEVSTCISWHTAPVTTFDQLHDTELIIGGDGPSADGEHFARVMNALFATKIRIVSGYPGGNAINLAVERGEVQGRCGWSWSGIVAERRQWLDERKINVLVQFGLIKHPDLLNVPSVLDYAKTDEQKQISATFTRAPTTWAALLRAAWNSGGPCRSASQGVHDHYVRPSVPCRRAEGQT